MSLQRLSESIRLIEYACFYVYVSIRLIEYTCFYVYVVLRIRCNYAYKMKSQALGYGVIMHTK